MGGDAQGTSWLEGRLEHAHVFWMQRKFHSRETRKSLAALERASIDARFEHTIDSRFDTTPRRLQQIYSRFDYDDDGMITVDQLRKGLESQDFHLSDEAFQQLLLQARIAPDGHVNLEVFSLILRCLRLAELFPLTDLHYPSAVDAALERMQKSVVLRVTDYCSESIARQWPVTDHVSFFFSGRPKEIEAMDGVRWVHVQELEATTLLKLATKYQLHPLAVEDALQMIREPAKVNTYGNVRRMLVARSTLWYPACCGVFQLVRRPRSKLNCLFAAGDDYFITVNLLQLDECTPIVSSASQTLNSFIPGSSPVTVHSGYIGIFMLGDMRTIITVFDQESYHHTEKDIATTIFAKALELSHAPQSSFNSPYLSIGRVSRRNSTGKPKVPLDIASLKEKNDVGTRRAAIATPRPDMMPSDIGFGRSRDLFQEIEDRLKRQNTKLRDFNADFLMHTILDKYTHARTHARTHAHSCMRARSHMQKPARAQTQVGRQARARREGVRAPAQLHPRAAAHGQICDAAAPP
jgi:Mg2+ and Co2+ transporter CorA